MTTRSASDSASAIGLSLATYSSAALVSCTEQGPTTTRSRASLPSRIASIARRDSYTLVDAVSVKRISSANMTGESSGRVLTIRRSSVFIARFAARKNSRIFETAARPPLFENQAAGGGIKLHNRPAFWIESTRVREIVNQVPGPVCLQPREGRPGNLG